MPEIHFDAPIVCTMQYLEFPAEAGEPPRQLKAFKKVELDPAQSVSCSSYIWWAFC